MKKALFSRLLTITIILGLLLATNTPQNVNAVLTSPKTIVSTELAVLEEIAINGSSTDLINFHPLVGPPPPIGVESLAGSKVIFYQTAGCATGYEPGIPTTLCFQSNVESADGEFLYNTWLKFPSDWTITDVSLLGTPTCNSSIIVGGFSYAQTTVPGEIEIAHALYTSAPDSSCLVNYRVDVTPSTIASTTPVAVSWYYHGDGYNSTPHHPCSSDRYTPSTMSSLPCDEWINPPASITRLASVNPVAQAQSVTTPEDIAKAITLVATDPNGGLLTYSYTNPTNGILSGSAPNLTYTPNAGWFGSDSFTFHATDPTSLVSNTATVSITVTSVNDRPIAQAQSVTTPEDVPVAITLAATDADNDPLAYFVTQPANGAVVLVGTVATYTPAANHFGLDSFTFKANDGMIDSNPATVSITVTPVPDAPVAQAQSVSTAKDVPVAITLVATDADADALTYSVVVEPLHGTFSGTIPNLTYTPTTGWIGADSFTFKANDTTVDSNVATVSITVYQLIYLPLIFR